jgi:RNA-directed DNA polymerase
MLTALEQGVKGGAWFSLMDKVYAPKNLHAAWKRVARNRGAAGIDRQTVEQFSTQAESSLEWIHEQLRSGAYRPQPVRRHWIPKPGTNQQRPLGIPTVRDRIVQGALRHVLEPIFERRFDAHSYGFRPGRGCKDALRRVEQLLAAGYTHVVDADLQSYFDTIDHELLLAEVRREVSDGKVLDLIRAFLEQQIMDGCATWTPTAGAPQGAVLSPLMANVHLHPVDAALRDAGFEMVRYADDLVILCKSATEAEEALALLRTLVTQRRLTLHPTKTRIVDTTQRGGFDFLGYNFDRGYKTPRTKSRRKMRDRVRELTPRNSGNSLARIVADLNPVLRGWFAYFKDCLHRVFVELDCFVRRRLRALLDRRNHRPGIGAGAANRRWTNAFFATQGLFSTAEAHAHARQSR